MKKLTAVLLTLSVTMAMLLAGCGSGSTNTMADSGSANTAAVGSGEAAPAEEEENYDTGDASLDDPRNADNIGDNELLVLSFGTSFNDSRRLNIGAIESDLEKAFPDYSVRRGFTANIVIDHVQNRDGIKIDDVDEAMNRAVDNNVKNLVIQPTHLMNGLEYQELEEQVAQYADAFDKIAIGKPLLTSEDDFKRVEQALVDWTSEYDDGETAICFMGHGTEAESNEVYQKMQDLLTADGHDNYFVGTVEASPSLEDVLAKVKAGSYKRVVLEPLMVVAGDHANNDMAGEEEDSWKTTFEDAGYEVTCLLRGLGENEAIRQIYVEHAQAAMDSLNQ
ncbi:sirohydrochlorin cobaltochelatase [Butyricicoccus sp.]|uniref:sirohydrochlorin cobaltochelatase n=1 Tax=Butyricicoccus sp. TaxID=2049021 RepID=UPI003F18E002